MVHVRSIQLQLCPNDHRTRDQPRHITGKKIQVGSILRLNGLQSSHHNQHICLVEGGKKDYALVSMAALTDSAVMFFPKNPEISTGLHGIGCCSWYCTKIYTEIKVVLAFACEYLVSEEHGALPAPGKSHVEIKNARRLYITQHP